MKSNQVPVIRCEACGDSEQDEHGQPCQECCPHDEHDHGMCLDCGLDRTEHFAAMAYDRAKDIRKYGE